MSLPSTFSSAASGLLPGSTQSVLDARGAQAAQILELTWVLFAGGAVVFAVTMGLLVLALRGPQAVRASLSGRGWIIGGGIVFPVVVLTALLVYSFAVRGVPAEQAPAAASIEVTGELWWWRVRYLDGQGSPLFESANEVHIPAGLPVDLHLRSDNVIHSFWVPSLAGKLDMIPGHVNRLRLRADAPGVFRGQCAEFCGAQHARMAFHVVAMEPQAFEQWLAAQAQPASPPADALAQAGRDLFFGSRCAICHAIRGTPAAGTRGPDLTHFGSRLTLAAATLPNTRGAAAGWIVDVQHIKPGALMPAYSRFSGEELRALSAYLESLR
jgi:cytochrome c oxidase subunit 2